MWARYGRSLRDSACLLSSQLRTGITGFGTLPYSILTASGFVSPVPARLAAVRPQASEAMAIVPTLRCRNMRASLAFYTSVLDFERVGGDGRVDDPAYSVLARRGDFLILSSHMGDGEFEQAVVVTTEDVDSDWRQFLARGLRLPATAKDQSPVHAGPLDQSWGTREVYVDDPDGNTLRFTEGWFNGA